MSFESEDSKSASGALQEIEAELERILARRRDEIERDRDARIREERDAADRRLRDAERDIQAERDALAEFRTVVASAESERRALAAEIQERIEGALACQSEIEALTRRTMDEIRRVKELQHTLEQLRTRTAERAGFLKNDLRERFGIVAEVPPEPPDESMPVDLGEELEKLRKIKELLAMESAGTTSWPALCPVPPIDESPAPFPATPERTEAPAPSAGEAVEPSGIPEEAELAGGEDAAPVEETLEEDAAAATETPGGPVDPEKRLSELRRRMESRAQREAANGAGEIGLFRDGAAAVIDPRELIRSIEAVLAEGRKLSLKLGLTSSPKEQFFVRQELIQEQETLRKLLHHALRMCETGAAALPRMTAAAFGPAALRELHELTTLQNWSNPGEIAAFEGRFRPIQESFDAASARELDYLESLERELTVGK